MPGESEVPSGGISRAPGLPFMRHPAAPDDRGNGAVPGLRRYLGRPAQKSELIEPMRVQRLRRGTTDIDAANPPDCRQEV